MGTRRPIGDRTRGRRVDIDSNRGRDRRLQHVPARRRLRQDGRQRRHGLDWPGPLAWAGPIEPVTSLSSILAKAPSGRDMLQPPVPTAIRININTAPAGAIADRPARPHVLYRACLLYTSD